LFLDESGESSFSSDSIYKHFLVTVVSIDPSDSVRLKNRLKRRFTDFAKQGWHKSREPKAYEVFKHPGFGTEAVCEVLRTLVGIETLEVSYIVVNKTRITNRSFRSAPYGTAYNYFTGVLLTELVFDDGYRTAHLVYDRKNKETHENKHFREYLQAKIAGTALERDVDADLTIEAGDSHNCYGLLAVDYFSWAIYRRFEHGDSRFFDLIEGKLKRRRQWYVD
jgi:hypothetical protein